MEEVILYTRQHENSFYELMEKGHITNKEIYVQLHMQDISTFFMEKYQRFVTMAEHYVQRPNGVEYPIWCAVSKTYCLKAIEQTLIYVLKVPIDQVIYFDGGKWDYVLNNLYIPADEDDKRAYFEEINRLGLRDQFSFIDGKHKGRFPEIEAKIIASWERIFSIDNWSAVYVQANLWEIKKEWVQQVIKPGDDFYALTKDIDDTFPPSFSGLSIS